MSKMLIKLSGIIAIAFSLVNIFIFIGIHFTIPYTILSDEIYCYYIMLVISIISFVSLIGGFTFNHYSKLNDDEFKRREHYILAWSVFFIFSCPISGILGFIIHFTSDKHLSFTSRVEYIEELKELNKLLEEGYITDEEFKLKKKQVLDI